MEGSELEVGRRQMKNWEVELFLDEPLAKEREP
jgi:hypothetical protein